MMPNRLETRLFLPLRKHFPNIPPARPKRNTTKVSLKTNRMSGQVTSRKEPAKIKQPIKRLYIKMPITNMGLRTRASELCIPSPCTPCILPLRCAGKLPSCATNSKQASGEQRLIFFRGQRGDTGRGQVFFDVRDMAHAGESGGHAGCGAGKLQAALCVGGEAVKLSTHWIG